MKYLLGLLVIFGTSDGLLTHFLVRDGIAREGNPLLVPLVGETGFIVLKIVGMLVCAFILWDIHRRYAKLALVTTWCAVIGYGAIVLWNLSLLAIA